jgi:hypothetical protein
MSGMKAVLLLEEQTKRLTESVKDIQTKLNTGLADHEKRLTRLETIVEIARPDGAVLRIARGSAAESD